MQSKPASFWVLYLLLAALILLRLLPHVTGFGPLWGVAHLLFLPIEYTIGYCAIGALVLVLPFSWKSAAWGERMAGSLSGVLSESPFALAARLGIVAACGVLFWVFSMPTHFLGDGYPYLANLGSTTGNWVKWTEGGAMQAVLAIQSMIGTTNQRTAELAFRILSVGSGVVAVWFFLRIARVISDQPAKRLLTFVALILSPILLLFFGYVESYPLMWGPMAGFFYYALARIHAGKGLIGATICLVLAAISHLMALIFVPAFLSLLARRSRVSELVERFRLPVIAGGVVAAIVLAVLFYMKYTGDLYFQNLFLWPFAGKPVAPEYAIFSLPHLIDIVNELLLVIPLLPLLIVLAVGGFRKFGRDIAAVFLAVASACVLMFLLVFDPSISMPRDWDLFAIIMLPLSLWLIAIIPKRNLARTSPLIVSVVLVAVLFTLPSPLVNLDRDRSIKQFKGIIDAYPEKSLGSVAILGTYYRAEGYRALSDSCENRMQQLYPRLYQMRRARQAVANRDLRAADAYLRQMAPDRYWKDYHLFLAERALLTHQLDTALVHARAAAQLQRYYQPAYTTLGLVHMARNELPEALEALKYGLSLDSRAPLLLLNTATVYSWQNQPESAFVYAKRLYEVDTTSVLGSCLLARGYFYVGDREQALFHARRYLEVGRGFSEYEKLKGELLQLMPELAEKSN